MGWGHLGSRWPRRGALSSLPVMPGGGTGETQPRKWSLGRHVEVWLGGPRCPAPVWGLALALAQGLPEVTGSLPVSLQETLRDFLERALGENRRPLRARRGRGRRSASWGAKDAGRQPTRRQEPSLPGLQGQHRATEAALQDPDMGVPKAQAPRGGVLGTEPACVGRELGPTWDGPPGAAGPGCGNKASIQDFGSCQASMGIAQGQSTRRTSWRRDRGLYPRTYR